MGGVVSALTGIGNAFINFIGRPFGIYTHDETFTDLQVSNLLTPKEADSAARRTAKHASKGDSMNYFRAYRAFQRDYRKKYSAQFMKRQGYAPSSTATAIVATKVKTEAYLETLYGYGEVSVQSFGDRYLTRLEKADTQYNKLPDMNLILGK